jgi:hypothetical protein
MDRRLRGTTAMMRTFLPVIAAAYAVFTQAAATAPAARPSITTIANFVVKTDDLDAARKFYSGVLGYDEVFQHKRAIVGAADISVFKVNDHQYIELAPTLANGCLTVLGVPTRDHIVGLRRAQVDADCELELG